MLSSSIANELASHLFPLERIATDTKIYKWNGTRYKKMGGIKPPQLASHGTSFNLVSSMGFLNYI
jgi:hypothetical protein